MRLLTRGAKLFLAGLIPATTSPNDVIEPKDTKTYRAFLERPPSTETGWERLKEMFKVDEFDNMSTELNSIYQAGFVGFLTGALYGGITQSRIAYSDFMDNNQATAFKSHLDAKRKLQDQFTINFARGAFKWGWRVGLFTTSYFGIITCISVYREKSSIYEYLAAGAITGGLYKFNMGLKGMTAGAVIGAALGGVSGGISLLLLRASGTSMEEVRFWQYKWRTERDKQVHEAIKIQADDLNKTPELFKKHDEAVGAGTTLESVK